MSTTEKPQAVHKEAVGVRGKFEADPETGWHTFFIDVDGWQHPLKLSTKKPDLIDLAKAVGKQTATWGYLESQGNPNPHGGFYMNRWLNSVAPLGLDQPEIDIAETPQAPHPAEDPAAPPPPVDWDGKELRGHRRAAIAISVSSYDGDPTVSEQGILARAERFVTFVYQGPEDLVAAAEAGMADADDIPFE